MKKNIITIHILSLLLILVPSCTMDNVGPEAKSGYFILTQLSKDNLNSQVADSRIKAGDVDFFLGNLKASREFYFILLNGGDAPIFDILLQTGDESFIITPDQLDVLPGSTTTGSDANPTMIPLITLGILHGTQLYGIGYTDLLEMGNHTSTIIVSGKTLEGGDTITVSDEFIVEIVAHIMDVSISTANKELDLTKWDFATSSNLGGLGFVRGYNVYSDDIEVKNTGNVQLQVFFGNEQDITSNSLILQPAETNSITIDNRDVYLKLDSDGTVTDGNKIQLGNDGNGYLCLQKLNSVPDTTGSQQDSTMVR